MHELSDTELVDRARGGDKEAFSQLAERYYPMARRLAGRMIADGGLAEDLAQEAVLQAYLGLKQLRAPARFRSWLYGIVLNLCRSFAREREQTHFFSAEALAGGLHFESARFSLRDQDPAERAEQQELHQLVLGAIETLSPMDRASTLLFYYQQLSVREIAGALGISSVAVKVHLHRARKQLRSRLLALDPELLARSPTGRKTMLPVIVADVIELRQEEQASQPKYIVVLLHEASGRALPIWVGPWEGQTIARALRKLSMPRPLTLEFSASLLQAAGATLEQVRIEALREQTFYASASIRCGEQLREVDGRPSDALALALLLDSPILVSEEVFKNAAMELPALQRHSLGHGASAIVQQLEAQVAAGKPQQLSQEQIEQSYADLRAALLARTGQP